MPPTYRPLRALRPLGLALAVGIGLPAGAQTPAPTPAPASAPASPTKDVVVDAVQPAAAAASAAPGRVVPTPAGALAAGAVPAARLYTSPLHDAATAAALGDLGLALLQQHSRASGQAQVNAVLSPLSVASALGMVHAGAGGETAREMATVLSSGPGGAQGLAHRLPSVLQRLAGGAAAPGAGSPFVMANRVWVRADSAAAIPATYAALLKDRYAADGVLLSFANADAARQTINRWTAERTAQRIPQLLPAGSVTPTTKLVVSNAVHFKSRWAQPFDPAATELRPFQAADGRKLVPTMVSERPVLQGTVDNLSVLELPFAGQAFSLLLAMAPAGHTLNALENDLTGLDLAAWSAQLKPATCRLELPRFAITGGAQALKPALQALGVRTVFSDAADLQPMLGRAAAGTYVDDVYHQAGVVIDELGGEAAAATAATVQAKSFQMPVPTCAVDRPFVFAIVHKPTGAPLFVGKVADPTR